MIFFFFKIVSNLCAIIKSSKKVSSLIKNSNKKPEKCQYKAASKKQSAVNKEVLCGIQNFAAKKCRFLFAGRSRGISPDSKICNLINSTFDPFKILKRVQMNMAATFSYRLLATNWKWLET